jgi:dsDNA-binding SOS-regulon protein
MRKYENGYWDKINYWANTLKEAVNRKDVEMVEKATEKLSYFVTRQKEVYS